MSEEKYTLYYWTECKSFWGRAIGIVLTLEEAKAKGITLSYDIVEPDKAPKNIGFATPMITLASGQSIAQAPAILNVLGTHFGLTGSTPEEQIACQQAVLDVNDIFDEVVQGKWTDNKERADKWFALLEVKLSKSKFLVTDVPTVADFHAVFAFEWVHKKYQGDYKEFPKLSAWWTALSEHACVKAMRNSGIKMIP